MFTEDGVIVDRWLCSQFDKYVSVGIDSITLIIL